MNCMICKEPVPEGTVMCPNCGAMPWQMPEAFLNEDQHKAWLDAIYKPQIERWERQNALQQELVELTNENTQINNNLKISLKKIHKLEYIIAKLKEQINSAPKGKTGIPLDIFDFEIQNYVLKKYNGQLENVDIPDGVTSIGDSAFLGCKNLQSINIPNSVTSIGKKAFSGCKNLQSINIPNSVMSIDNEAFWGCEKLDTVYIPNSMKNIGRLVFRHCVNLKKASIPGHLNVPNNCFLPSCKIIRR